MAPPMDYRDNLHPAKGGQNWTRIRGHDSMPIDTMAVYTIRGPYKAYEQGLSRSPNVIGHLIFHIQNGKRVLLWPQHLAEGKFLPMPKWEDRGRSRPRAELGEAGR